MVLLLLLHLLLLVYLLLLLLQRIRCLFRIYCVSFCCSWRFCCLSTLRSLLAGEIMVVLRPLQIGEGWGPIGGPPSPRAGAWGPP